MSERRVQSVKFFNIIGCKFKQIIIQAVNLPHLLVDKGKSSIQTQLDDLNDSINDVCKIHYRYKKFFKYDISDNNF